ncbi:hypothetical protein NLJ89_g3167 [Agrocybe chaxingu]|uniref:Ras modification protein ERF4 n=1 Tax=Agrocybe chaxingu TaxID=84603 RepID=A0A9W8K5E8_9AGAR|nr:hypothetical protein NLJ89_g3167 [Agrocybe chaxingu]
MSSAAGTSLPDSASFHPVLHDEHKAPLVNSNNNTLPHSDPHPPTPPSVEVLPTVLPPPPTTVDYASRDTGAPMGLSADSDTRNTTTVQQHDVDASVTVEGDFASNTMAEETLVEGDPQEELARKIAHVKGPSSSSFDLPPRENQLEQALGAPPPAQHGSAEGESTTTTTTTATATHWNPMHPLGQETTEKEDDHIYHDKDKTVIVEEDEDDIVDSKGRLMFPDETKETTHTPGGILRPSPAASRRASHLRLDLKPPSPQPWDHIDPPLDNNLKSIAGYYSPGTTKFRTLQSAGPRPLIPKSSYYFGPPPPDSAYGTAPTGQIGVHHPREILRVERDYTGGELIQFAPIYPLELENRITPTQFLESINAINEILISAHSLRHSFLDNVLAVFSLQLSTLFKKPHWEKASPLLRFGMSGVGANFNVDSPFPVDRVSFLR